MKNRLHIITSPLTAALATLVLASSHASAANQTWTNTGSVSANWSESTNWGGNTAPGATSGSTSNDTATFTSSSGTYGTSENPILIDSGRNIRGLTFNGSVGNYTIGTTGGNALHMTSGGSILIGNGLTSNNTTITINAPLLMYGGLTINNQAPNLTNKIVIGGAISSATAGAKTLSINSVSASSTNVNEITGLISNGNASATVSVTQSTAGGLWRLLNDANSFTGNLSVQGGSVYVSSIGDQGVASAAGAGTTINIGSSTAIGTLFYTGNAVTTNRTINMAGTSGGANIYQNGSGLLKFTSNITATGVGTKLLTLRGTGAGEAAGTIVDGSSGSTQASTTSNNSATLVLGSVDGLTVGQAISGTGITPGTTITAIFTGNKTVTLSANASVTGGAVITSLGLVNRTSLTKLDAGTWTLSGTNTYSGNTTVSGGILTFANTASKSSSSNVTATAGAVGLGVGGAGYYTAANVGTLFNTGNFTGISLASASGVAIDTTNAGGTFDQSTALDNATRSLTKLGTGTLVLSTSNTLSSTIVNAGTLQVGNANALGSGTSALAVNDGTLDLNGNSVTVGALSGTGSSAVVTSGAAGSVTLTSNTTSTTTYAGSIQDGSGKVGLTKSGNGTLTLTGSSSYTGLTTVSGNGSILAITNANALGASGIGNGTTVNTGARLQLSNNITLTESLTISSVGTSNNGGLISAGGNNTISSAITLGAQSRIVATSGTLTLAGGVTSSNTNLTIGTTARNATVNITSAIDLGSGAFNAYAGAGITDAMTVLGVTGNNFSLVRADTGGTIRTDVANAWNASANMTLGSAEASAQTNTFDLNGNSQTVAHLNSANDVSTGGNVTNIITSASAATLTMSGTGSTTYSGQITNAMALTKNGTSTQVLTGNNSYSGATTVNAGVLNIRHNNALGSTAGGTTVSSNAALQLQGNITVTGEALSLSGGGVSAAGGALRSMSGNNTWAGDITIGTATTRIASDAGLLTLSGNITGTSGNSTSLQGNGNILVSGTISGSQSVTTSTATLGVVTLEAANTFTGAMSIIGGTVSANSIKDYNTASSLGKAGSGNIVIGGFGISGTLLYTGTGDTSNRTFQIGTNSGTPLATDTGSATIQNDGSGALVFTATIFNSSTNATTGAGADRTLTLRGSNAEDNTISGVIRDNIVSGTASGTARIGLIKNGAGKWILGGNNTYTGTTTINQGTLEIASNGRLGGGTYSGTISNNGTFIYSASGSTTQRLNGAISGSGSLTYNGSSTLSLGGAHTYGGGTTLAGSGVVAVDIDSVGSAGSPSSGAFGTGTVDLAGAQVRAGITAARTVANAVTISADTTFATASGEKSLTFTGPVTLSGATRTLDVAVGSTVNTANLTFSGAIGDGGNGYGLTKNGTGTLVFGGANTYTGTTAVNAGALNVTSDGSLSSGSAFTLGASATANLANADQILGAVSNANSASNALNFSAATGTVTLASLSGAGNTRFGSDAVITGGIGSGTVTAIGSLTANISGGTTTVGGVATIGTMSAGTANLNGATSSIGTFNGGNIALGNSTTLSVSSGSSSGVISGGGSLNKTGSGALQLLGINSYTGGTTISEGTLAVNGSLAGNVTVNTGTILQGAGSIGGALSVSGQLAPGNSIESIGAASVSFLLGSTYAYEFESASLNGDLLYTLGELNITTGTLLSLTDLNSGVLAANSKLTLISYVGGASWGGGLFTYNGNTLTNGSKFTIGQNEWLFRYDDTVAGSNFSGDQASATRYVTMTVIPEPSVAMMAGSLAMMALLRRRRD